MGRGLWTLVSVRVFAAFALVAGSCLAWSGVRSPAMWAGFLLLSVVSSWTVGWWVARRLRTALAPVAAVCAPEHDPAEPMPATGVREFEEIGRTMHGSLYRMDQVLDASIGARQELEAMLDSMQDAVVAVDAGGRIQWTNQRMQRLVPSASFSSTIRIGHALVQAVRDPDVLDCVRDALAHRQVCERRSISLIPGRIFEVSAAPMPGGGAVAVLHDITRIEQIERTQQDFVANVSHELRTPLTSITGYVETLLDHEAGLTPLAREFLGTILKNATRMNRLTEELLVMARIDAAEQELHPAPIRADELVRDAVEGMSGLVQGDEAVIEIGEVTATQVFADTDAVQQVLGNLIENAIKYGRARNAEQARVVLSAREVTEPYEAVEFSVRDFGQGISSEHLDRIFERFYRVDKARSRESGGTGLGLAIVKHMVQAQGGWIRAESKLNGGSNFLFTLPKALYPVPSPGHSFELDDDVTSP